MKKIILLLASVCLFISCHRVSSDPAKLQEGDTNYNYLSIIVIDSCEYIYYSKGYRGSVAHKGNCKFCKERNSNK